MTDLITLVSGLTARLHAAGLAPDPDAAAAFVRGLTTLSPPTAEDLYWTGRTTLIREVNSLRVYDACFIAWLADLGEEVALSTEAPSGPTAEPASERVSADEDAPGNAKQEEGEARPLEQGTSPTPTLEAGDTCPTETVGVRASELEALRRRRFDAVTPDELEAMRSIMHRISLDAPERLSRRRRLHPSGTEADLRRSLRLAMGTDGELIRLARRRRIAKPRSLVLVLDVSGSMARSARALLQFAFSARTATAGVEVFCFATKLTRLTEDLRERDIDVALARAVSRVTDWEGGTRIGASLAELNRVYGPLGRLRGAVVVIYSDGLERGDPRELAEEVGRLSRQAYRLLWLNPLKGDADYEPLARGMAAALPHIDRFLAGHDLASLEELADVLGQLR